MKTLANIFRLLLPLVAACLLGSCGREGAVVYSQFADITPKGWNDGEYCRFETALQDSSIFADPSHRYDVDVTLRLSDAYPLRSLTMNLQATPGTALPREITIPTVSPSGEWYGTDAHGLHTITYTAAKDISLPPCFQATVSPAMNRPRLPGVVSVGITIRAN